MVVFQRFSGMVVALALALASVATAYAPTSPLFVRKQRLLTTTARRSSPITNNHKFHSYGLFDNNKVGELNMASSDAQMFQRKCPFFLPSDNVKFNNRPSNMFERICIRIFHWMSRVMVQWGAFESWNPIVKILTFILYQIDIIWAGFDKEYYVKRREMFGPNYISAVSLVVSKYDENANFADAIDTRFLTIPQRRGLFLGSTLMNENHLPHDPKGDRLVSPLHVSDNAVGVPEGGLGHDEIRNSVMENVLGEEKLKDAKVRAEDSTTKKLLEEFGEESKGLNDVKDLSPIVERFLIKYYNYVLFDLPISEVPVDLFQGTFYTGLRYILYIFGPAWLFNGVFRPIVRPRSLKKDLDEIRDYYAESPVLEKFISVPSGPNSISKEGLLEMIKMLMGVAAFQGTKALGLCAMTQIPKDTAREATKDPDALRRAVLEAARLDAPVTGAHCIVNEADGLETTIGGKTLTFPRGTTIFTAITLANTDSDRFECPYVFDPDRPGMPEQLTSFNSVGEKTGESPRICPGREIAVLAVCQMLKAKIDAET